MAEVKDGFAKLDSYAELEAYEKKYASLSKEINTLDEEIRARKEILKRLVDERFKIQENDRYEIALKILNEHKYWACRKDFKSIAKLDKIDGKYGARFLVTGEEGIDKPHYSSTYGMIANYPIPITEEKYNEIYNNYKNK